MIDQHQSLILASRSPRRRQLLAEAGYEFTVVYPDEAVEQGVRFGETPRELVCRLAYLKAADVASRIGEGVVLGCDTLVECQGSILGKPRDRNDARRILQRLNGQVHHVYSGLCVWRRPDDVHLTDAEITKLKMEELHPEQLESYLESNQWEGKAGAFGYQDRLSWIRIITGSESNVVGLPLELLERMLAKLNTL